MSELNDWQKTELLARSRLVVPDAELCKEESYSGEEIRFTDSCGCYSEYTQEPCSLTVTLCGTLKGDGHKQRLDIEDCLRKWADGALNWNGCDCCGNDLSVNCYLFQKKVEAGADKGDGNGD